MEPLLQACSQAFNKYKTADQARKDEKLRAKNLKKEPIEAQLEAAVEAKKDLQDDMEKNESQGEKLLEKGKDSKLGQNQSGECPSFPG